MPRPLTLLTAVALAATAAGCGGGNKNPTSTPTPTPKANSVAATKAQLAALAKQVGHDIFWAGARRGYTYELTHTTDGNVYIRYLPPGVPVGAGSADFLAVGTYPQPNAFGTIQQAEKRQGETIKRI